MGHSVKIKTLEGEKEISLGAGTQNGQQIKLEGKVIFHILGDSKIVATPELARRSYCFGRSRNSQKLGLILERIVPDY